MDSRKPLTAGARERLTIATMDAICDGHGSVTVYVGDMQDVLNSLSVVLTTPTDSAVREAVERLTRCADEDPIPRALADDLRTLLRAVQSPRLTPEQVEAVWEADKAISENVGNASDYAHEYWSTEEGDAIEERMNLASAELRAAFPELAGEVRRG